MSIMTNLQFQKLQPSQAQIRYRADVARDGFIVFTTRALGWKPGKGCNLRRALYKPLRDSVPLSPLQNWTHRQFFC